MRQNAKRNAFEGRRPNRALCYSMRDGKKETGIVENTSDLEIIAVSLESKKGKDTFTVLASTFEADEPTALIKPHETYILTMALSNTSPNVPLQIGSVMYLDGTEEGCEPSLKLMRHSKTYHERVKAEKKGSVQ